MQLVTGHTQRENMVRALPLRHPSSRRVKYSTIRARAELEKNQLIFSVED